MQLDSISIDGFGVLSEFELEHIAPGLNVFYGANGSGKSTVLQFLRGVFSNFDHARQLRLLPPLKGSRAGGSVNVVDGPLRCEIIRHARAGHHDTLGIKTESGDHEDAQGIRSFISQFDRDVLQTVFFVSGPESHQIEELVRLSLRDGIPLKTERRQATWIAERIETVRQEREDLFGGEPSRTNLESLEVRKQTIAKKIADSRLQQSQRDADWEVHVTECQQGIDQLVQEANWLHNSLQVIQSDLTEIQDRLWSRTEEIVEDVEVVERVVSSGSPEWIEEIEEIDQQIEHAQQVLRDLASSRLRITLASAGLTGAETPESEVVFERQRAAINSIENETNRLFGVLANLEQSSDSNNCICRTLKGSLQGTLTSIQQQLALLCQELSRHQTASEQLLLLSQRDGVDRCEIELTQQIQALRLRRDELLHSQDRTFDEQICFRTGHELAHCGCSHHIGDRTAVQLRQTSRRVETEQISQQRVVVKSLARPDDANQESELLAKKGQLLQQWWEAQRKLGELYRHLAELERKPQQFAEDYSLQELRLEYAAIEQQLADAREQWQSLAVLQAVLQRTQSQLNVETVPPVIEEASLLLSKMTKGRYQAFRWNDQTGELLVLSESEAELPIHALSRGTLDQAALSFRCALWNEYQRRGLQLPLILDEVLADSDESRLEAAIDTLIEFSGDSQQIIFLTCQEHLANLFELRGLVIRELPHSKRRSLGKNRIRSLTAETRHQSVSEDVERVSEESTRVQPDEPYWLQTQSAAHLIPSIGEQMARRLGSLGVRTAGDLIDLDPENSEIPLESLQISAATLRTWQAESRLLICVPHLTGRDAQLLVLCGIFSPAELAEFDADELLRKVDRLRASRGEYGERHWLQERSTWPQRDQFGEWIRHGRRARSLRDAREWSSRRRRHAAHRSSGSGPLTGRIARTKFLSQGASSQREYSHSGATASSHNRNVGRHSGTEVAERVRLHTVPIEEEAKELRFYLNMDSPIVDAPSIGPKTAKRFEKIGVMSVSDFVRRDAAEMSKRLNYRRLTENLLTQWQQQAVLVCRIPELRGHDAQVLVACDLTDADEIAQSTPEELFALVSPFVNSTKGQQLLRSAKTPDLEEVTDWIEFARQSRTLRAA